MADKEFKKIGTLTTKPDGVLSPTVVQGQQIYVVVGFGVNNPNAYKDGTAYIRIDPGHAFMYTVRNNKVTKFFSFGPRKHGEFVNTLGTPDYGMDYATRLFKVPVSAEQMDKVESTVDDYRKQALDGSMPYRGITNDTCAETVRQILSESGVSTPNGTGPVGQSITAPVKPTLKGGQWPSVGSTSIPLQTNMGTFNLSVPTINPGKLPDAGLEDVTVTPSVNAVNPYKWYDEFKKSGKYKEVQYGTQDKKYWSFYTRFENPDPVADKW